MNVYPPEISVTSALHSSTCTFCAHRGARVLFKRGHFSGPLELCSETSPDYARVPFYLHCSLDVNKDGMTF